MIKAFNFSGLAPRIDPRKLPPSASQRAQEVRLLNGNLMPLREAVATGDSVIAGCKTFYPFNGSYLSWIDEVCIAKNPLVNDQYQRIYYTGDGVPKYAAIISTVTTQRALGVPAPTTPLTVSTAPKSSVSWYRKWYAFYEDVDGTRLDEYTFPDEPDPDITENTAGASYTLTDGGALPPNPSATGNLVIWFEAYTSNDVYLGACYPQTSMYRANTDLIINGAAVTCTQTIGLTSVTVQLQYNTSRQTGFDATRTYVYTWVTDVGEESAPSEPVTIEVSPVQDVDLVMPTNRPYTWVVSKRVYRSVTDSNGITQLRLVGVDIGNPDPDTEIPYNESNGTDRLLDEELELDTLATEGFDPPPADLDFLAAVPGGFMVGASGRTLYYSEPFLPYAWPYSSSLDADVKGIAVADNTVVVATAEYPYVVTGLTPDGMAQAKLPLPMAGTSKRGIIAWQGRVMYTSPDGLVEVIGGSARLVTEAIIDRDYWQALNPATMRLFAHDNMLLVGCDTRTLIFTYDSGQVTFTDTLQVIAGAYHDVEDDQLEVVLDGETAIKAFNTGADRTFIWQSKDNYYPLPQKMGAYRVQAQSYPVTLRVYSDGNLAATVSVSQGKAMLLPSIPPAKVWSLEIEADTEVYSVETAPTIAGVIT